MTNGDETKLVNRYRALVEDIQTPNFDQMIKAAATRQAIMRRFSSRLKHAFLLMSVVAFAIGAAWRTYQSSDHRKTFTVTNYGRIEGFSSSYLLEAGTPQYVGPGVIEGAL